MERLKSTAQRSPPALAAGFALGAILAIGSASPAAAQVARAGFGLAAVDVVMLGPPSHAMIYLAGKARHRRVASGHPRKSLFGSRYRWRGAPVGSGGPIVERRVPVGPAPSSPGVPIYTPPVVQAPAGQPHCVSQGTAVNPSTGSFQSSAGICP